MRLALPLPARALLVKGADVHSRPPADQSRYLFSRLLLRKPTWIRLSSLLASSSYSTDISDLPAACAELWRIAEPVAGPSTPPKREQVAALVEPKKEDSREGFLDLTLTDSDDDVPPPVSVKGKKPGVNKGKARATPRTLISDVPESLDLGDLSRFAFDQAVLIDEPPEHTLALLSMDELTALGKRMKVPCKSGASVRPPLPPSPQEHVLVRLGLTPCLSLSLSPQRGEWTKALLKTSNQSTLSFFIAAPPPPKIQSPPGSADMERKPSLGSVGVGYDAKGNKLSQSRVVAAQALKLIGASLPPRSRTLSPSGSRCCPSCRSRHPPLARALHPLQPPVARLPPHVLHGRHLVDVGVAPHGVAARPLRQARLPDLHRLALVRPLPLARRPARVRGGHGGRAARRGGARRRVGPGRAEAGRARDQGGAARAVRRGGQGVGGD